PMPAAPAGNAATPAAEPGPPAEPAPAQPAATPPAEPPPPKPAPKPQPAVKPFEGFAKAVALPPLPESGAGEPQALGPVRLPEKLICFIRLKGGANACKGTPEIQFRNANNGTSETEFEALLAGSKAAGDSLKVADFALRDGQLFFQWTAEAASDPNAITLSNCALTMNLGAEMHEFALRVADVVPASELNLSKPDTLKIQVANLPDPLGVRVQLLKTGGTLPPHVVEPDVPVPADNGEMKIKFGQTPEEQVLELDVDFDVRRDVQATVTPYFRWPLDEKPVKLTKATVTQASQSAATNRLQLVNLLNQMRQAEKSVPAAQKALFGVELTKVEQQLAKVEAGVQSADRLRALLEAAGDNCQLHFRVFYDADGFEVDLARTE
ncbi:MAG: hypothetical protein J5I93_15170, partial [Pirellulaceae bacterium]|nr:hypothetical protein [Pirellulaceae bacterium]